MILVVCDLSNPKSIRSLDNWFTTIKSAHPQQEDVRIIIVGAKYDIRRQNNLISLLQQQADQRKVEFFTCSAKTGEGVAELLSEIAARNYTYTDVEQNLVAVTTNCKKK